MMVSSCINTFTVCMCLPGCAVRAGVFTEANERVHARLAMVGVGAMVAIELLKGSALL